MHDVRVLRLSEVFRAAEADEILNEPTFDVNGTIIRPLILGDSAYPFKTWLLRPFKDNGALNQHQKNFNNHLSQESKLNMLLVKQKVGGGFFKSD